MDIDRHRRQAGSRQQAMFVRHACIKQCKRERNVIACYAQQDRQHAVVVSGRGLAGISLCFSILICLSFVQFILLYHNNVLVRW
jgi:hypothetical protein